MNQEEIQFGKLILQKKLIDSQTLSKCLELKKSQGISLMEAITRSGYLTQHQVAEIYASSKPTSIQSLGKYKIVKEVGRGGMGRVYQALDTASQRIVALKIIDDSSSTSSLRLLREAKATARLNHPNIVTLYEVGEEQGQHFFSMEFIEGKSLEDFIKNDSISIRKIVALMIKVTEAMQYAHENGVIHRDIKPDNIMLDAKEEPQILDFGLAKLEDVSQSLTVSGTVIGTVFYMPPEQAEGRISSIDARSDVYALGGVLYMMLTGRPPFTGNNFSQVLKQILNKDPIAPSHIKNIVPKSLDLICLKALAKSKNQRYQTAKEMQLDLQKFLQGAKISGAGLRWKQKITKWLSKNAIFLFIYLTSLSAIGIIFYDSYRVLQKANKEKQQKISVLTQEKKEFQKKMSIKYKKAEELYKKSFQCFTENNWEQGWKEIVKACLIRREKRYMLLKGFYYWFGPESNAKKSQKIVQKYLPQFKNPDAKVCYIIGRIYKYGILGKVQINQAIKWYQKGAQQGFAPCIESLGEIYLTTPQIRDVNTSFKYFQKAAGKYHWADYFYAQAYHRGEGVKVNIAKAIKHYKVAAHKNSWAALHLGHIYRERNNHKEALKWYKKATKISAALYRIAIIYDKGGGVKKDPMEAIVWASKAAEKKHEDAIKFLLDKYIASKNYLIVWWWLKKINQSSVYAMFVTGKMYEQGWGIKKNNKQALVWYQRASNKGSKEAKQKLKK